MDTTGSKTSSGHDPCGTPGANRSDERATIIPKQRTLILHYHLFKNAGTSIDEMLKHNFGERWAEHEFAGSGAKRSNVEAVAQYVRGRPDLVALSSHTALLPAPDLDGITVFPIIFVRHPIDRLHSAYVFERAQRADTAGARLAKEHDFPGYLRELLKPQHKRQARNFQTFRLAMNEPHGRASEIERARRALNVLPFVGLVDAYEQSVGLLESLLKPLMPGFRPVGVQRNMLRSKGASLRERLAAIKKELRKDLLAEVKAANSDDLEIFRTVQRRYIDTPQDEADMF